MAAAVGKRKLDEVAESAVAIFDANKKAREGSPGAGKDVALAVTQIKTGGALLPAGIKRTSGLEAPTMLLTGHSGEVFTVKFSPDGNSLASAGFDREILLWRTYGECENYMMISGHKGPILDLHWNTDGSRILTASVDETIGIFDAATGDRVRRLKGHTGIVNSCCPARRGTTVVSGSDDGTIKIWDTRRRGAVTTLDSKYQVTAVCFSEDATKAFSGGIDNVVKCWDLRKNEEEYVMEAHKDTVTGLALSPDGSYLLSNGMDNTVRAFDVRPYKAGDRQVKHFVGAQHNFEKNLLRCNWSPDGKMITAGSADRMVYVWDVATTGVAYKLPGHAGSVNETCFHPTEPICMFISHGIGKQR